MTVMVRETWTDERLDDLKEGINERFDQVDKRFDQVDKRFDRVDADMKAGFARVDADMKAGFARVDGDIKELRGDVKEMQRTMIGGFVAIVVALIGTSAF